MPFSWLLLIMIVMKNKYKLTLASSFLLLTFAFSLSRPLNTVVKAVTLPTSINVSNLSDESISGYYAGVEGLKGTSLSQALHEKIKDHVEFDYESTTDRYAYKIIDRNWDLSPLSPSQLANYNHATDNPYIMKLYADYNLDASTADLFKNPGASRVSFDKEHIWAQSLGNFGRRVGAGSDFHHLWPSDVKGNQQAHSNYNYAVPTSGITEVLNDYGTPVGRNGYISGSSQKVFEPLDEYKGDIARAMLYMPVRYNNYIDEDHPHLELVNGSPSARTSTPSQTGLAGDLATLLAWNELDPVSDYEIKRNNLIYHNYQGNRNPFIDHPEWAKIVYDTSYSGSGANNALGSSSFGNNPSWHTGAKTLDHLTVDTTKARTSYYINDKFSLKGLVVQAFYTDLSHKKILSFSSSMTNQTVLNTAGTKTITLSYLEAGISKSINYTIEVLDISKVLSNLELITTNVQKVFPFGSSFNNTNLQVIAHYSDNSELDVTSQANITSGDILSLGYQNIYVTFEGKTESYQIKVTNENSGASSGKASDLFISEYIEGSSNNKGLEIFNGTGTDVNLAGYSLKLFTNGAASPSKTLDLSGALGNNSVYVIVHGSANSTMLAIANKTDSAVINWNGDDTIGLYKNDVLIDLIGEIGVQNAWAGMAAGGNASGATTDRTLVRIPSVDKPNTTFTWSEWNAYVIDTTTYLGSHITQYDSSFDFSLQAHSYANYFLETTGPYCEERNGNSIPWSTLADEYGYMVDSAKNYFVDPSTTNEDILEARARYLVLINGYPSLSGVNFMQNALGENLYTPPTYDELFAPYANILPNILIIGALTIIITTLILKFSNKRKSQ